MKKVFAIGCLTVISFNLKSQSIIDNATIGTWNNNNDFSVFMHSNLSDPNNYALLQKKDGPTYLNSKFNQSIKFRSGNIEKMVMTKNGEFGIGITNPTESLEIYGAIKIGNTANENAGTIKFDGSNFYGYTGTDWVKLNVTIDHNDDNRVVVMEPTRFTTELKIGENSLTLHGSDGEPETAGGTLNEIYAGQDEALHIQGPYLSGNTILNEQSGSVGIGTANVDIDNYAQLHVSAPSLPSILLEKNNSGRLRIGISDGGNTYSSLAQDGDLVLKKEGNGNNMIFSNNAGNDGSFIFQAASNEIMRVNGNGNIGIGTNIPDAQLHVIGDIQVKSKMKIFSPQTLNTNWTRGVIGQGLNYNYNNNEYETIDSDGELAVISFDNNANIRFINQPGWGNSQTNMTADELKAQTRMIIDEYGRVGINTECFPDINYKLAIDGKVICEELKVRLADETGCWPDYVFDKDYKIMPLNKLEEYIKSNKHLPNIPPASKVDSEGLSLGEMSKLQMTKIEELTLHLIESNKKIISLERKIQELQNKIK